MAAVGDTAPGGLPRPLLAFGLPLVGLLLVAFFVYRGFPYAALGDRIAAELERAQGVRLGIQDFGPALSPAGPGVEATGVRATLRDGRRVRVDRAFLRPAWSLAWLTGRPALWISVDSELGSAEGTLVWGSDGAWDGRLSGVDLSVLPLEALLPGGSATGRLDATADVHTGEDGPEGPVLLEVRDGSLSLPNLPVAVPFERLSADLRLGGDAFVEVRSVEISGPLLEGSGGGRVARAPAFEVAPLDLQLRFTVKPALAGAVRGAGLRVDRNGSTSVRISGTVANPRIR